MSNEVIRRLRRKVALASIAAIFVSLAALVFAINYAHWLQTDASLRTAMEEIATNIEAEHQSKQMGGQQGREDLGVSNAERVQGDETGQSGDIVDGQIMHGGRKSARTQYASRFFCVLVGSDGEMLVRAKGTTELSDENALDLAQRVLASGKAEGYLDDYKYVVDELGQHKQTQDTTSTEGVADIQGDRPDTQTRILFLDCTTELQSQHQLVSVSLAVGGCALIIAAIFILRFSGLAVRPLAESAHKQKQFVSDAGHELKTPLSVIATNMDILEADLADRPEEQEWIDSTNRQVDNMRRLVNDLITLSKMEEVERDIVQMEVSLTDLAYECVSTFDPVARAQGKRLVPAISDDVRVKGDEPAIRQLMSILVDNAIKYATGDGSIEVEVRREGRSAVLLTRNAWERNVDTHDLPQLFDRFVRGEQSRDRSGGASGYGLGLSIARAIAERNGARLEAHEDPDGRIVFRATFSRTA